MPFYARSENAAGEKQLVRDHLQNVAALAEGFAAEIGLPRDMGRWAGLLHDLGKYSPDFQLYRMERHDNRLVEHAGHGAAIAWRARACEIAFAIMAHHAGLPDGVGSVRDLLDRPERAARDVGALIGRAETFLERARADGAFTGLPSESLIARGDQSAELRIRMLLSCLVDADRLDAERWQSPEKSATRESVAPLNANQLLQRLLAYVDKLGASARSSQPLTPFRTRLLEVRDRVFRECIAAGRLPRGLFSLTVPTGGGKTLSSLAFALAHAAAHSGEGGIRRIILVLPYLTIIEQIAAVIRAVVGADASLVLEHHSGLITGEPAVPDAEDDCEGPALRRKLLAENWDVPIVVTTSVQFFESLFNAHPKRLRKIHNIARSVVIFDEVQALPREILRPLTSMVDQLRAEYGCSFVFSTATQPALRGNVGSERMPLFEFEPREITSDPAGNFTALRRVAVRWEQNRARTHAGLAAEMVASPGQQALAVVNVKADAQELFRALTALDPTAIHLSTRMCARHRSERIALIHGRLRQGEPCLVASTQLVEAGVDLDFPKVYRAFGPLSAIAQAAGRANREGGRGEDGGEVVVFRFEQERFPNDAAYRQGAAITRQMLDESGELDINDPALFQHYSRDHFFVGDLDQYSVRRQREQYKYLGVEQSVKLIDEETTAIVVPYRGGADLIARLGAGETSRRFGRLLQPYIVNVYTKELDLLRSVGIVEEVNGVWVLHDDSYYDPQLGLTLPGETQPG